MNIEEARSYLKSNTHPEYHHYIKTRLASDFAITIAEKMEHNKSQNSNYIYMGKLSVKLIKILIDELCNYYPLKMIQVEPVVNRITRQVVKEVKNCSTSADDRYDFEEEMEKAAARGLA